MTKERYAVATLGAPEYLRDAGGYIKSLGAVEVPLQFVHPHMPLVDIKNCVTGASYVVFTGGKHVAYSGVGGDHDRDEMENDIWEMTGDLPRLGICRGGQLMVLRNHGSLRRSLPDSGVNHYIKGYNNIAGNLHRVTATEQGIELFNSESFLTPSGHEHAAETTGELEILAYADDGVIEAYRNPSRLFEVGVQWHPELSKGDDARCLFQAFAKSPGPRTYSLVV